MSKAILVMDMPESCFGCNFMHCDEESDTETCQATETARDIDLIEDRPKWCPLRELPEKRDTSHPKACYTNSYWTDEMNAGFNACLDEITGGASGISASDDSS